MDAKTLKRLQELVRLAVDSGASEAEARSAAIIACRMLVQHDVFAMLVATPSKAVPSPKARKAPVEQGVEEPWAAESDGWDAYAADYDQRAPSAEDEDTFEPEAYEERAQEVPKAKDERRKWRGWLRIDSKFPSWCYWCDRRILKNDDILWDPGTRKCVCARCREMFERERREGRV
jgi:hypothetical protein